MIELPRKSRKIRETPLATEIETEINRLPGVWAMRNHVGLFYTEWGSRIRCGLGTGSPDIVGVLTLGSADFPIGLAFGLEVKTPHAPNAHPEVQKGQKAWRRLAASNGMPCTKVTSVAEAVRAIEHFRSEMWRRMKAAA